MYTAKKDILVGLVYVQLFSVNLYQVFWKM